MAEAELPGITIGASHRYSVSCLYRRVGQEGTSYAETAGYPIGTATRVALPALTSPVARIARRRSETSLRR